MIVVIAADFSDNVISSKRRGGDSKTNVLLLLSLANVFGVPCSHDIRKLLVVQFLPPGYSASPALRPALRKIYRYSLVKTLPIEGGVTRDMIRRSRGDGHSRRDEDDRDEEKESQSKFNAIANIDLKYSSQLSEPFREAQTRVYPTCV